MIEATFPVVGPVLFLLVVLPAFSLLASFVLRWLEWRRSALSDCDLNVRYVLLLAPSVFPIAWLFSAAVHFTEIGCAHFSCFLHSDRGSFCLEPWAFFGVTAAFILFALLLAGWRHRARFAGLRCDAALQARLDALIKARRWLSPLHGRVIALEGREVRAHASGIFRGRVLIGSEFAARLDDESLAGALGHELEHLQCYDSARYALLDFAFLLNPFGSRFLAPHRARWRAAREAECDRRAVLRGASPLALAGAIVEAARPRLPSSSSPALALGGAPLLKLRVDLLIAFDEQMPRPCCTGRSAAHPLAFVLLLLAIVLPHHGGAAALDSMHMASELLVAALWSSLF